MEPILRNTRQALIAALVTRISLFLLAFLFICSPPFLNAQTALTGLQTNYQTEPLGIDAEKILFSWQLTSDSPQRGLVQKAYQIIVKNEANETVWNTQEIKSGVALGIRYQGKALVPRTRYTWTISVWTGADEKISQSSWFETGLMNPNPDLSAWNGASWIGGGDEDVVLESHYLTVFKIQYQLQFEKGSTKAAFLFGGNDRRLMDANFNLNEMEVDQNESYVTVELDIAALDKGGNAKLKIYRNGFAGEDSKDKPLKTFDIPQSLINKANQYDKHRIYIDAVFGLIEIYINGRGEQNNLTLQKGGSPFAPKGFNLNPFGAGNDFICFPVLGDIGFNLQSGQKAHFSNVEIRHFRAPSNILFAEKLSGNYQGIFNKQKGLSIDDNGYQLNGAKNGTFILANPSQNAAPMLRTTFQLPNKRIQKARVYATARGIYELYLNGQRVGTDYFNPGLTQYNKHHLYQTYDVTDLVQQGTDNALGAWLSEGWWSGNTTFKGENWNFFGDRQSLLAQLIITYTDGTETLIRSNPKDWQLYTDGPIRYGSFFQGEIYDATKEAAIEGWATANYTAKNWKSAIIVPLAGTSLQGEFRDFAGRPQRLDYSDQKIMGQFGENVSVVKTLTAQSVEEVRPGVFVYDMGQNMVGVPNITIENGKRGEVLCLRFAEVRYPDLPEYKQNSGMIMLENIRAALAQDLYTLKGGDEVIQPRFTFHGYRYLEITGIDEALPLDRVKGSVLSSVSQLASTYETSNDLVNQLWSNITWSLRSNFLSIPTDCPARNERMGWNGDINVFARAATWLTHANPFLKRHLMAMRDMQSENGRFSDVAPIGNGFGGTLWGSAGIVVTWETYQQYGDVSLLEEHYEAMIAYVGFLASRQNEDGILNEGPLGDWLSPENAKNDNTLLWTAYQIYDLSILEKVAILLGNTADAQAFQKQYEARKAFFNEVYIDNASGKTVHSGTSVAGFGPPPPTPPKKGDLLDTQASYTIPLALGAFDAKNRVRASIHLATTITRKNTDDLGVERPAYSLMTGFIGTASIGEALSENGLDDLSYRLLQSETYPSWLYPVKNGATTIWERLNSFTNENGFGGNNSMNSFNHYAFGAIAAWMYNYSLGIQRGEQGGFKHFILKPTPDPDGKMTFAKGHYDSMYGRIVSQWNIEAKGIRYQITIPPNTSARLYLKAEKVKKIRESGQKIRKVKGVEGVTEEDGWILFELVAGSYDFFVKK